jgi:hypothetical protein
MDMFQVDLSVQELQAIRQSLDTITLVGKDAKFLAGLQMKVEYKLSEIEKYYQSLQDEKQTSLQKVLEEDSKKPTQSTKK